MANPRLSQKGKDVEGRVFGARGCDEGGGLNEELEVRSAVDECFLGVQCEAEERFQFDTGQGHPKAEGGAF